MPVLGCFFKAAGASNSSTTSFSPPGFPSCDQGDIAGLACPELAPLGPASAKRGGGDVASGDAEDGVGDGGDGRKDEQAGGV